MIKDIESNTKQYFPSDHFPVELRLKIKLAKHRGRPPDKSNDWKSPQKCSQIAQEQFKHMIAQTYRAWAPDKESENKEELDQQVSALKDALEEAAETHLEKRPKDEKDHKRSE